MREGDTVNPVGAHSPCECVERAIKSVEECISKESLQPVAHKVLVVILQRLLEVQKSLSGDDSPFRAHTNAIRSAARLLDKIPLSSNAWHVADARWDVADSLKEILPHIASDEYLYRSLLAEKARRDAQGNQSRDFESAELEDLLLAFEKKPQDADREKVRRKLAGLFEIRNDAGRHRRARERLRWQYLTWVGLVLGTLLVSSTAAAVLCENLTALWTQALVVFLAGGFGAVLSSVFRIRDLETIGQLDHVWSGLFSQTVVGGALAVTVLFVFRSQLISFATIDLTDQDADSYSATLYLIGLLSGYAEPFAIGLLKQILSLGRGNDEQSRAAS